MGQIRFRLLLLISIFLLFQFGWGQTDSLNISWDRNPTEDSVAYYILYRAESNIDTNFSINDYNALGFHIPQTPQGIARVDTADNSNAIRPGYFISYMVVAVDEQGLRSDFSDSKGKGLPQIRWQRTEIDSGVPTLIPFSEFLWDLDTPLSQLTLSITQISHLNDSVVTTNLWLTPDPLTYTGPADLIMTVTDPDGFWDRDTINLIILSDTAQQNNKPNAVDDQITTYQNQPVMINPLTNDSDPDGDPIFLVLPFPVLPQHGTLELLNNSTVRYAPATDYIGQDNFDYQISDGRGGRDTATVSITVLEDTLNHNPMAEDDYVSTNRGISVNINPLINDLDPDGDQIYLIEPFPVLPQHGTLELLNDSLIRYTPETDYIGPDNFDYKISDGRGGRDTATVSVTVRAVEISGENTIAFPNPVKISDGQTLLVFEPIPAEAQELWIVSPALGNIVYKKVFDGIPPSRLELSLLENDLKDLASGFYIYLIKGKGDKKLKSGKIAIIR